MALVVLVERKGCAQENAILDRHIGLTLPKQQNLAILPGKNAGHTPKMADLVRPFFP
jgi:hypothetical protein